MQSLRMTSTDEAVRDLCRRLPHVSEQIVQYFLSQGYTTDECYEKLRDGKYQPPSTPPDDRPYAFTPSHNTNSSPSLRRGTSYPIPSTHTHESVRAQNSDRHIDSHTKWRRNSNESTPHRHPPSSPRPHRLSGSEFSGAGYNRPNPTRTPSLTDLVTAQQESLDRITKIRDHHVSELSTLRAQVQQAKEELSELRVTVSKERQYEEDIANDQDLIKTLRFDINDMKKEISIMRAQVEMKDSRDVYTEEGIRWQCPSCGFLNHPLLPTCERCSERVRR